VYLFVCAYGGKGDTGFGVFGAFSVLKKLNIEDLGHYLDFDVSCLRIKGF